MRPDKTVWCQHIKSPYYPSFSPFFNTTGMTTSSSCVSGGITGVLWTRKDAPPIVERLCWDDTRNQPLYYAVGSIWTFTSWVPGSQRDSDFNPPVQCKRSSILLNAGAE